MKHLNWLALAPGILHYSALHYSHGRIETLENVRRAVSTDLQNNGLSTADLINKKIFLDFRCEGQGPHHIKWLIEYLASIVGMSNLYVVFTAVVTESLPYRYQSIITEMVNHVNYYDNIGEDCLTVDKKFLCLNHRASLVRAQLLSSLFNTINREHIRASFGSSGCPTFKQYQYLFNKPLPLLIDTVPVNRYMFSNHLFKSCLFNIIPESSSQQDPIAWDTVFITEKTFKSFASLQIPIWFAVPGLVDQVRKLGFDVFDDIVDHSYDSIQNQDQRMGRVVEVIKNIDGRYTIEQCQHVRHQLYTRLKQNQQLIEYFIKTNPNTQRILKEFLD
jgi:hypothetical protein